MRFEDRLSIWALKDVYVAGAITVYKSGTLAQNSVVTNITASDCDSVGVRYDVIPDSNRVSSSRSLVFTKSGQRAD